MKLRHACIGAALAAFAVSPAQAQELRIGFLNTTSGGGALVGAEIERGWKLGLKHNGWEKDGDKLGGLPTRIFYADDQMRPDIGVAAVKEFLERDKVQIVTGIIWSNVMMAVQRQVFNANAMLVSGNAGPTPLAGRLCNPLFVSAAFVNDQAAEASGMLVSQEKAKTVVILVPNYQAGKDVAAGFKRTFKGGKIALEILYKLGQTDFQADLSRIRAAKPEGVFVFAPGSMGIAFVKQWHASGLNKEIKLYSMWTVSHLTLPAIGEAAVGSVMADHWNPDLDLPRNKTFVKDYIAAYKVHPSHFAMTSYDSVGVIVDAVKAAGGKLDDMKAVARAVRTGSFRSLRGDLKFNANGFPIQPFWKLEVVKGPDGKPRIEGKAKIMERPDDYVKECPPDKRT
jgi:branched-chain amino acid transport system substrate-binding protein